MTTPDYVLTGHKCIPVARAFGLGPDRSWHVGALLEKIPDHPEETHCLHMATPLKSVVFAFNQGDFQIMIALCVAALEDGLPDPEWLGRMAGVMRVGTG
jgi:hypothetical protein